MKVSDVAKAVEVLAPFIEETVLYLNGGPKPAFFDTIPEPTRSRVVIDAMKARKG